MEINSSHPDGEEWSTAMKALGTRLERLKELEILNGPAAVQELPFGYLDATAFMTSSTIRQSESARCSCVVLPHS